jgi:hypothetical protein
MKNQYFGDKRDYFKYGLLEALTLGIPGLEQLTCLWMLTRPIENNDGKKPFVAHADDSRLAAFLEACRSREVHDIRAIQGYFQGIGCRFFSFRDQPQDYFSRENRSEYFRVVPQEALQRSVVFFDPDNGLEPEGGAGSAHLRYRELNQVFNRMDIHSVAVVYQHLPRIKGSVFWPAVAGKIRKHLNSPVGFIAEGDLAFYVSPRDPSMFEAVMSILRSQGDRTVGTSRGRSLGPTWSDGAWLGH